MSKSTSPRKKNRTLRWVILLGAVLIVAFLYVTLSKGESATEVTTELVEQRTILSTVEESGTVEPVLEVAIAADVSGEIVELRGKEGEQVKKGDLLVTIQPDNYQSALEQAKAALNTARANELQSEAAREQARTQLLQDSSNYARTDQLYKKEVVPRIDWETAQLAYQISRSNYKGAKASLQAARFQVASSKASLGQAQSNLRRTNIFATMDGTLTLQNVKEGERVVGTVQMAGTEVLRIADLSAMQVKVEINENDIRFLRVGDSAHIQLDAFEDRTFTGTVTELAFSPVSAGAGAIVSTDQITTYEVKVQINADSYLKDKDLMNGLPAHQSPFRPGMSAQVEIFTERVEAATSVPIQAVTIRKPEGGEDDAEPVEVVFVYGANGILTKREVTTGINDDTYIVVTEGLKPGEKIVSGPYRTLTKELEDGMKVVQEKEKDQKTEAPKE